MKLGKLAFEFVTLMFVSSFVSSGLMHAQEAWDSPDFSATQLLSPGGHELRMKVYRSGSMVRVEESDKVAVLFVPASKKVYSLTVYPDNSRTCVVMRTDQAKMMLSPLQLLDGTKVKRTPAGTEVVEGHNCKVENVTVTRVDGQTIESKVWEAEDLKGAPVKIESQLSDFKFTAVYRDVVLATPDKALFTPPDKCIPIEKMGQVAVEKKMR